MKKIGLLWVILLMGATARAQTPQCQWGATSTGLRDTSSILASATDAAGNVYVAGWIRGQNAAFGPTVVQATGRGFAGFVSKLSANGQWLWTVPLSSPGSMQTEGVVVFGLGVDLIGNVYVGGSFDDTLTLGATTLITDNIFLNGPRTTAFVASLTPQGQWRWALRCAHPSSDSFSRAEGLAVSPDGRTTITGVYTASAAFGATVISTSNFMQQGFVARASAQGSWEWAVAINSASSLDLVASHCVALDGMGNATVAGLFEGVVTLGTTTLTNASRNYALFVAQLSPTGQWRWAAQSDPGGPATPFGGIEPWSIAAAATGAVYVNGGFARELALGDTTITGNGPFVASLSSQGQWQWVRAATGGGWGWGLAVEPVTGDVLTSGTSNSPAAFDSSTPVGQNGHSLFLACFTAAGAGRWTVGGGNRQAQPTSVTVGAGGTVYLGGQLIGGVPATFGSQVVTPGPGLHSFVIRLDRPLGLTEQEAPGQFTFAPNPARHTVRLSGVTPGSVIILDAVGRTVSSTVLGAGHTEVSLSVEGLAPGVYVVKAGGQARRLVVE